MGVASQSPVEIARHLQVGVASLHLVGVASQSRVGVARMVVFLPPSIANLVLRVVALAVLHRVHPRLRPVLVLHLRSPAVGTLLVVPRQVVPMILRLINKKVSQNRERVIRSNLPVETTTLETVEREKMKVKPRPARKKWTPALHKLFIMEARNSLP